MNSRVGRSRARKAQSVKADKVERSSGNVFADLGFRDRGTDVESSTRDKDLRADSVEGVDPDASRRTRGAGSAKDIAVDAWQPYGLLG